MGAGKAVEALSVTKISLEKNWRRLGQMIDAETTLDRSLKCVIGRGSGAASRIHRAVDWHPSGRIADQLIAHLCSAAYSSLRCRPVSASPNSRGRLRPHDVDCCESPFLYL